MDSTITRKEVLPEVSKRIGKLDEMRRLTEATMRGEIPFRTSFLNRVKILSDISVSEVNQVVSEIPLNPYIADFIENNRDRCYVVTGNLDVWISGLMKKLKMENHCYCSKADVKNDRISKVVSVADLVIFNGRSDVLLIQIAHGGKAQRRVCILLQLHDQISVVPALLELVHAV